MEFSRQENWIGCHFLLQGILPTQGSNFGLLHLQADSLLSDPSGKHSCPNKHSRLLSGLASPLNDLYSILLPKIQIWSCYSPYQHLGEVSDYKISSMMYLPAKLLQLCPTLCDPMDCHSPRLLCPWGFSRKEYWCGLPCSPPGDLPTPGTEPMSHVSCIGREVLYH